MCILLAMNMSACAHPHTHIHSTGEPFSPSSRCRRRLATAVLPSLAVVLPSTSERRLVPSPTAAARAFIHFLDDGLAHPARPVWVVLSRAAPCTRKTVPTHHTPLNLRRIKPATTRSLCTDAKAWHTHIPERPSRAHGIPPSPSASSSYTPQLACAFGCGRTSVAYFYTARRVVVVAVDGNGTMICAPRI